MNKIETIKTQEQLMAHYCFIKDIPIIDTTPETMLARCLLDQYRAFSFVENDEPVGILIYRDIKPVMYVVGIYLKDKSKGFYDMFYSHLKELGYTYIQAQSKLTQEQFEGFSGMGKIYSIYAKEIL